jgi:hypothetical protein
MLEVAASFAREGVVALLPTPCPDGDRKVLARLHQRRIDMADSVLVVGEPGEDTTAEATYAATSGKPVHYTEERPAEAVCVSGHGHCPTVNFGRDGGPCAHCGEWAAL